MISLVVFRLMPKGLQIMVHYLIFAHKNRISPVHAKLVYYVFSRKSRDFLRFSATILSFYPRSQHHTGSVNNDRMVVTKIIPVAYPSFP